MKHDVDSEILEVPVLIVGGGPAGLTMALELARRGITGMLIERRDFTSHFPRAHLLNVRTMETFADVGVADDIYAQSPPEDQWHRAAWYTSLAGPTPLHGQRIGYVDAWGGGGDLAEYEKASPRKFANLPQIRLDRVLAEHAKMRWPNAIRSRTELIDLEYDEDHAIATVLDHAGGATSKIRARYVVAADGGRTLTGLLGVSMEGPRALIDHVSVYFSADLSGHADEEALLTYFVRPEGQGSFAGALLGLGPKEWGKNCTEWLVGMSFHLSDPALESDSSLIERAKDLIGIADLEMQVHSVSHWQFEGVVADRFRVGPVFIVGDAAHRHPPTGGLGLNTAVGDVSNLAWKLASVLKGNAKETLLDTYEPERRQIALQNVEHSLRNAGRHAPIAEALGLRRGIGIEEGWKEVGLWASDSPEGERRREAAAAAIAANRENFSQLNIEAGFCYEQGALVPDAVPAPVKRSPAQFVPSSRPGHHLPHVWVQHDGAKISTTDLIQPEGLTLLLSSAGSAAWGEAAALISSTGACPIHVVVIGEGGEYQDPQRDWEAAREVHEGGAILVRPDRHVAWRAVDLPSDVHSELKKAVERVIDPVVVPSGTDTLEEIERITVAGEALRTNESSRQARIFSERGTP
ncbi:aromatic ring hydroxylase [Arthrobacter sp. CDRTa11]|uniref:FAD-dependent monooxygenase n=1 Tax=Arthrobacter sp. CDRTa11 TaxID=2651199 RepID=UPI002265DB25|nr:FAD-dependent monooxygenase [Arthrobacter sp. CDRTa11]UZX02871.1 aromatic ring hydroxylase [Arthrobacter sp. CDRTa11]